MSAITDGGTAFHAGRSLSNNPYSTERGEEEHHEWDAEWFAAFRAWHDGLAKPAAPAITLPAGWVAHTPYLAERTADRAVVVMDQHNEDAPPFARSTTPGAGRFGYFSSLTKAVEFYDKQWPARPAGWTWQATGENHGPHWRRDADGFRVTETLDQWRGVTPDGYMTTSYYKTAEAVMAFAEQTRPAK